MVQLPPASALMAPGTGRSSPQKVKLRMEGRLGLLYNLDTSEFHERLIMLGVDSGTERCVCVSDMKVAPPETMGTNLAKFIDEVRAVGAEPILVTSLTRRSFNSDNVTLNDPLGPWANGDRTSDIFSELY